MGWRLRQLMRAANRETSAGSSGSGRGGHDSLFPAMAALRALASWRRSCSESPSKNWGGRARARGPPPSSPSPAASGSSIQLCTKSAKQLSPSTRGWRLRPLFSRAAVQSSASSPRQCSRQASGVDLGRGRGAGGALAPGTLLGRGMPLAERRCLRRGHAAGAGCWSTGSSSSLHVLLDTSEKPESQSRAFSLGLPKTAPLSPITTPSSSSSTQQTESSSKASAALGWWRSRTRGPGLGGGGRGPDMGGEPVSRPHSSSQRSWLRKLSSRALCMPVPEPPPGLPVPLRTPAGAARRGPSGPASGAPALRLAPRLLALRSSGRRRRPNIWQQRPAPGAAANGGGAGLKGPAPRARPSGWVSLTPAPHFSAALEGEAGL